MARFARGRVSAWRHGSSILVRQVLIAIVLISAPACGLFRGPRPEGPPAPKPTPLPSVARAPEPVVARAWAEPRRLPPAGGQTQILVLVRKRNGDPFQGVEVQVQTSEGTLYSASRILTTDAAGRTRDRLTTRRPAVVTVNAGGAIHKVEVAVADR
jgi:hypothetical protein